MSLLFDNFATQQSPRKQEHRQLDGMRGDLVGSCLVVFRSCLRATTEIENEVVGRLHDTLNGGTDDLHSRFQTPSRTAMLDASRRGCMVSVHFLPATCVPTALSLTTYVNEAGTALNTTAQRWHRPWPSCVARYLQPHPAKQERRHVYLRDLRS